MPVFFLSRKLARFSAWFCLATVFAILAGCSSGGGSSSTTTPPATGIATTATISLSVSPAQILSTATSTSNLTAIVLDATGQVISGKAVTFSVNGDTTAYFTNVNSTSNTNGVVTATLNIGSNQTNRTITVSASADGVNGTNTVKVVGTTITVSGNTTLAVGTSTALTLSVKNSGGVAVPGVALTVTSANGNTIALSGSPAGTTDVNGQIVATVTATSATTPDTLTIAGAGASQTQALTITTVSSSFAFTAPITIVPPATTPEILVNTPTTVSVLWNAVPAIPNGTTVNFYTTRGTLTGSATTVGGVASVSNLTSAYTGATILEAVGLGGAGNIPIATLNVVFVTNTASSITAQAIPSTIGINSAGSQSNQSVISVVVRDAVGNLVKNANVSFNLVADPSGGSLSAPVATTDIHGIATANYYSGSSVSAVNATIVGITVNSVNGVALGVPITSTATLTVAGQTEYVRLQTDNTVQGAGTGSLTYTKVYQALVTDSAGHAVPDGTPVYFTLHPTSQIDAFAKGQFNYSGTAWTQSVSTTCPNEDTNNNGQVDIIGAISEDTNGNGQLDPYGTAVVNTSATTVGGFANATITYSKNYADWVVMQLEARTTVAGNDPPSVVLVPLVGAASDYTNSSIAPPGEFSPWGIDGNCGDTL